MGGSEICVFLVNLFIFRNRMRSLTHPYRVGVAHEACSGRLLEWRRLQEQSLASRFPEAVRVTTGLSDGNSTFQDLQGLHHLIGTK